MIFTIKTKKESEIESVFSDIDYDTKKDIISYLYWKFKFPEGMDIFSRWLAQYEQQSK